MQRDEPEIRQLIASWMQASKAGDVDTVLGLMTEDVVFLQAGRPPMIGKAAFAAAAGAALGQQAPQVDGRSEIQEITISGDWAYVWSKLTLVVTPPGKAPSTRSGYTLSVLKRHQGRWLLARDANMLSPASKAEG